MKTPTQRRFTTPCAGSPAFVSVFVQFTLNFECDNLMPTSRGLKTQTKKFFVVINEPAFFKISLRETIHRPAPNGGPTTTAVRRRSEPEKIPRKTRFWREAPKIFSESVGPTAVRRNGGSQGGGSPSAKFCFVLFHRLLQN